LGSANIECDCRTKHPNCNLWDYVIGYSRKGEPIAYFVEVHPAGSSNVGEVEKKAVWLVSFLQEPQNVQLRALRREYHWVASGGIHIPPGTSQYRRLQKLRGKHDVQGPTKLLLLT
jgi:hypothetical protein